MHLSEHIAIRGVERFLEGTGEYWRGGGRAVYSPFSPLPTILQCDSLFQVHFTNPCIYRAPVVFYKSCMDEWN